MNNLISVDCETTGLDIFDPEFKLLGISSCVYIDSKLSTQYWKYIYKGCDVYTWHCLRDNDNIKVFHNSKFDLKVLEYHADYTVNNYEDTMLMAFINNNLEESFGLKELAKKYLNIDMVSYKDTIKQCDINSEQFAEYAKLDAKATYLLYEYLKPKLIEKKLWEVYKTELALVGVLKDMELTGVKIDVNRCKLLQHEAEQDMIELIEDIRTELGDINISSGQQLGKALKDYGVALTEVSEKSVQLKTDKTALSKFSNNKLVSNLLEYKRLNKLCNTYYDNLLENIKLDGRIHTNFNQCFTKTGRLSSSDPINLQNQPKTKEIRNLFVAEEGKSFIVVDYSQIEPRLTAHFSQDENLLNIFKNNKDLYIEMASALLGKKCSDITKEERQFAKSKALALFYGATPNLLVKTAGLSCLEAQQLIKKFFYRFNGVKNWIYNLKDKVIKDGYVTTINGRRIYVQKGKEFKAVNYLIQGSASDVIKEAMINIYKELVPGYGHIVLSVHDEIVFECSDDCVNDVASMIESIMIDFNFTIPPEVDLKIVKKWGEAI